MLFDSRDTIYCPLREVGKDETFKDTIRNDHNPVRRHTPQAYRVTTSSGGTMFERSLISTRTKKGINASVAQVVQDRQFAVVHEIFDPIVPIYRNIRNNYCSLIIYCFYIDFDGITYGTVRDVFIFKPYEGDVDIRSLQAYPIQYATNNTLSVRGETFLQLTRVSHKQYEGLTAGPNREEINSPVIVDVKLAFEGDQDPEQQSIEIPKFNSLFWLPYSGVYDALGKSFCLNPWCYDIRCNLNVYSRPGGNIQNDITSAVKIVLEECETLKQDRSRVKDIFRLMKGEDLVTLLPGAVPGFALRNRRWVLLDINLLGDVELVSEWKNLFLPPGHQSIVQAMVETHSTGKDGEKGMDLVRGKGKGCIILLHGVPGVGKTSTAECVAAHTKKPLYPITCGDIGYKPEEVERNMETHFKLAHRWGCVLLLDEADVFLAKRDQRDVQRNGLVSVFLRVLEYYSGILFLTTNRVGDIDDAFRSRLHLTLYYPKLTKSQTKAIFSHNFTRIAAINSERKENGLPPFEYTKSEEEILKWAKKNYERLGWNGRQIRNAFQTVLALSEFDARGKGSKSKNRNKLATPTVELSHFKTVANAAIQFNEYLKQTHGYDEDRRAKRETIRAVDFSMKRDVLFSDRGDSSDQSSGNDDDSGSGDNEESMTEEDRDHSDGSESDSDHKKKKKSKVKQGGSSKGSTKRGNKAKGDKTKSEKKSKDKKKKKKKKEETEDTDDSE
ncbi:hypothetical protein F4824DRAFT_74130 [Ustulina deusta]|nr:hypothetical protein F4824DRAFT_74130 [Ustulina deusta]